MDNNNLKLDKFLANINYRKFIVGAFFLGMLKVEDNTRKWYAEQRIAGEFMTTWKILFTVVFALSVYMLVTSFMKQNNRLDLIALLIVLVAFVFPFALYGLWGRYGLGMDHRMEMYCGFAIVGLIHFKMQPKTKKSLIQ